MEKELKLINFKTLRKGSKVFSLRYGNGKVSYKHKSKYATYPVCVEFKSLHTTSISHISFTEDGRSFDERFLPDLYADHIKGDHTKFKTKIIVYTDEKTATDIQS